MATQIEFHGEKLTLNGNKLSGNTFAVKEFIKAELGGRWDAANKCWAVDSAKVAKHNQMSAPAAAPASTPARPANWRMSDEITIGLAEEGRLAIEECPKGHRIYTVEVFEDTSFDSAWLICQTWVACPINVAPPPQNIVDGTQRQALAGMLVWAPGWVKPGKDAWSY
jgi:hypothetical protein